MREKKGFGSSYKKTSVFRNIVVTFLLLFLPVFSFAKEKPLLWNMERLKVIRNQGDESGIYKKYLRFADSYLITPDVVIIAKEKSFAPDKHYYSSLAPYWWPDPESPGGKYIRKDGVRNPEINDYDGSILSELCLRLRAFSIAYYFTKDTRYKEAYLKQLDAFFLDENTYMYPNLEYAQVVPGYNNNRGRGAGIVTADCFLDILDSYRLVNYTKPVGKQLDQSIRKWFSDFLEWMLTSEIGMEERESSGNISLFYDVLALDIASFVNNKALVKEITDNFRSKRLEAQIELDGSQPLELARTKGFSYSIYNLQHIVDFCIIQESLGKRYYRNNRDIIDRAFMYLFPFIGNQFAFKYKQITSWDDCEEDLKRQIVRLQRLRPRRNKAYDFTAVGKGLTFNNLTQVLD